jgi:hypothetical protein
MKNKFCYYCGKPATSKEHVPPKQLFAGQEIPRFTVPSCEKHNGDKSGDDEAIIKAMLMSLDNPDYIGSYPIKVQNLVKRNRPHYSQVKRNVTLNPLVSYSLQELAYIAPTISVEQWIRQVTSALICAGTKTFDPNINLDQAEIFAPDFLVTERPGFHDYLVERLYPKTNLVRDWLNNYFEWLPGWRPDNQAYPPELFQFSLSLQMSYVKVRLKFLGQYTLYWLY